jgi:hypothetical protein
MFHAGRGARLKARLRSVRLADEVERLLEFIVPAHGPDVPGQQQDGALQMFDTLHQFGVDFVGVALRQAHWARHIIS